LLNGSVTPVNYVVNGMGDAVNSSVRLTRTMQCSRLRAAVGGVLTLGLVSLGALVGAGSAAADPWWEWKGRCTNDAGELAHSNHDPDGRIRITGYGQRAREQAWERPGGDLIKSCAGYGWWPDRWCTDKVGYLAYSNREPDGRVLFSGYGYRGFTVAVDRPGEDLYKSCVDDGWVPAPRNGRRPAADVQAWAGMAVGS
jgi:hypothetical protein